MDELINNFAAHLEKIISPSLGNNIRNKFENSNDNYDYNSIKHVLQHNIENYFMNCTDKDLNNISKNIFNTFVEIDDENLMKAVSVFIRFYSHFQSIRMRSKLYKWYTLSKVIKGSPKGKSVNKKLKTQVSKEDVVDNKVNNEIDKKKRSGLKNKGEYNSGKNIHNKLHKEGMIKKDYLCFNDDLYDVTQMNSRSIQRYNDNLSG